MDENLLKLKHKVQVQQHDIMMFSDNLHRSVLSRDNLTEEERRAKNVYLQADKPRFVSYSERIQENEQWPQSWDIRRCYSQGFTSPITWKGTPLFKTAYDLAILQMLLWELQPRTIVEIGSGLGTSATYLHDMCTIFGLDTHIITGDITPIENLPKDIEFHTIDCNNIDTVHKILDHIQHPCLFIEDAHVNVYGVLKAFMSKCELGDYILVEDSTNKQEDIEKITSMYNNLKIDRYFLDFFGKDALSVSNGILKVM